MEDKIKIEFNLNQTKFIIYADPNEPFKNVVDKYIIKAKLKPGAVCILVNGKINPEGTVESLMTPINKEKNTLSVIVESFDNSNEEKKLIKSKDIICPECYEPCKIKLEENKITLYDCPNKHKKEKIKVLDLPSTQIIDLNKIVCANDKDNNMGNSYQNQFFKCLTCESNLCLLCQKNHDKDHVVTKYEQKDYICPKHNSIFMKYCRECKQNLCIMCDEEHEEEHDIIEYKKIAPKKLEINSQLSNLKKEIESFQKDIQNILTSIEKLKELIELTNAHYQIKNEILNSYDIRNTNYNILENIAELYNNNILFETIKKINQMEIGKKINQTVIDLYNVITNGKDEGIFESKFTNLKKENNSNFVINSFKEENLHDDTYEKNLQLIYEMLNRKEKMDNPMNNQQGMMGQGINMNQQQNMMMQQNQQGQLGGIIGNNQGFNPISFQQFPFINIQNDIKSNNWTLQFEIGRGVYPIQISSDKLFEEAVHRFRNIIIDERSDLKFTKLLNTNLTLVQNGLKDGDVIKVIKVEKLEFINSDERINIFFESKGQRIQSMWINISPNQKFFDAINNYRKKVQYEGEMMFFYNGMNINRNLTIKQVGLKEGSKILVVVGGEVIG